MVVQKPDTSAYDAVRAMEDNHIGMILVQARGQLRGVVTDRDLALRLIGRGLDPRTTTLQDVMTENPLSLNISAERAQVIDLMRERGIRRVPLLEDDGQTLAGLVTLDDLLLTNELDVTDAAEIVYAQLAAPAREKPEGLTHPSPSARASAQERDATGAQQRHAAHAAQSARFADELVRDATLLDDLEVAHAAFETVVIDLTRRLTPTEAHNMLSQLPETIRERALDVTAGPDRAITRASIESRLVGLLGVDTGRAADVLAKICNVLTVLVSPGQVEHVRAQLPEDLRELFLAPVYSG